jgi:glycosyltransferase involved in cell wall biosynthesis
MQHHRKNIFFIASWLPSKHDAYEGDFILRHAQAAALLHNVTLVYAIETNITENKNSITDIEHQSNLTIYRIYLHKRYNSFILKNKYYKTINQLFYSIHQKNPFQIIHANVHWRAGYSALQLSKKYKIPFVLSEHSAYFNTNYYSRISVNAYSFLKKIIVKNILRKAAMVLPVSNYLAYWIKKFEPATNTNAVSNVVDETQFCFMPPTKTEPFVFLHASMGWPEKNIDIMIDAVRILSLQQLNFELHLYTPITTVLKTAIQSYQLHAYIKLRGTIAHSEMPNAIKNSHATILYSSMETQGCILLESLCCGRPIIAGSAPVFTETVSATNGYKNSYNSPENLMQLMHSMITNYETFDQVQISKDAIAKYGMVAIAAAFDNVYQSNIKA